jgi:thioredoxin 1
MSNLVTEIDDASFEEKVLNSGNNVVVDFWAPWCGPCRALSPIMDEIAEETKNVTFYKVNIDNSTAFAAKFGVRSIPALLLFKGNELVDKHIGAAPKDQVKELIEQAFDL